MRVRVFLRPRTVYVLLARKNKPVAWLCREVGLSTTYMSLALSGKVALNPERREALMRAFRGSSHKAGGRLKWDDLFQACFVGSGSADELQ